MFIETVVNYWLQLYNYWLQLYNSTVVEFISNKTVSIKTHDKRWVAHVFKMLIQKRNHLWKRYKKTGNEAHHQIYKRVRNAAVTLNRWNIKQYHWHIDTQLSVSTDPKLWWCNVKNIISAKAAQCIPPIEHNGRLISNDAQKAEIFNKYCSADCQQVVLINTFHHLLY